MRRLSYLETIPEDSLTSSSLRAFSDLATMILKYRGGPWKSTTEVKPALDILHQIYPELTVPATIIRRTLAVTFIEAVLNKRLDPGKYAPQNLPVQTLLPGTYFGITSQEPADIMHLSAASYSQYTGEIHLVFGLGETPGFEVAQLRQLLLNHTPQLIKSAAGQPALADQLGKTLPSLRRAMLKIPHFAVLMIEDKQILRYNDLLGVVDFQVYPEGKYIPKAHFDVFLAKLRSHYTEQKSIPVDSPNAPMNFKLEDLKNRTVGMIGTPPRGWSTDRFQTALRPYKTKVEPDLDYNTTYAFFDPETVAQDKLNQAKSRGIKMIPYKSIIPYITSR